MMTEKWIVGLIAGMIAVGGARAELVLVKENKSLAPIILAADATPDTRRAATELANYIEKISGAKPETVTGWPDSVPKQAIWVGIQPGLDDLFPETTLTFDHPEEILLAANANHVLIAGRDRLVADQQVEFGTANAVYTFLQKKLNVRWLWPGPLGEDIIQRKTIAFAPFEYRYHPQFRMRELRGMTQKVWKFSIAPEVSDWARFQRLGFGSMRTYPRTSFSWWGDHYGATHPEYLALQPDGTRTPTTVNAAKVCMSNPGVWAQWIENVTAATEKDPTANVFGGSPSDGHNSGICVCENCRAWDVQEGPIWGRYRWRGLSQEYVAMSDRYATFVNILADKLKENFPSRDLYVYDMAYGPNTPAPLQTRMADNTIIGYVGFFPLGNMASRQEQKAQFKAWSAQAPNLMYRPNYWYFGGGIWGLPEVALSDTIEDYRFLAEHNCIGLDIDVVGGHWATQGPQYYLLANLAWDPMQDGQALLADYYNRAFGPAAGAIAEYWQLMDEARVDVFNHPKHGQGSRYRLAIVNVVREIFNGDRLTRAEQILDRATASVENGYDIHRLRVAFVRAGFDSVRNMLASATLMEQVRATKGADAEAIAATIKLWEEIRALADRFPHAINYQRLRYVIEQKVYMGNVQDIFGPPSEAWLDDATNAPAASSTSTGTPMTMVDTSKSNPSITSPAKSTGWKLAFHDTFDRKELGPDWIVVEGDCSIRNEELISTGMTLLTAHGFPGFHRLEYQIITDVKPFALFTDETRKSEVAVSDFSALIQVGTEKHPIRDGYFFQFGGGENTYNFLWRDGTEIWRNNHPEYKIVPDKLHHIIWENDEGLLRFIVDGNVVFEGQEPSSLVGEGRARAGLYLGSAARIKEIKLYVKELDDGLI